jgi:hypothetical protein
MQQQAVLQSWWLCSVGPSQAHPGTLPRTLISAVHRMGHPAAIAHNIYQSVQWRLVLEDDKESLMSRM